MRKLLLPLISVFLFACGEDAPDCLTSTGSTMTEVRQLPSYFEVYIEDNIDVSVTSAHGSEVTVEAGENIISKITTTVTDGRLEIKNENKCNWMRSATRQVKVILPVRDATAVLHHGAGDLRTVGKLQHDSITFWQYGGGDAHLDVEAEYLNISSNNVARMYISGKVTHLLLLHNSIGKTDASQLENLYAYAENRSHGEVIVNTSDWLHYQIFSSGNIRIMQVPETLGVVGNSGTGQLIYP